MEHGKEHSSAKRNYFRSGANELSYVDYGGDDRPVLLLLHGHMNDAGTFAFLASRLRKDWRVIGLDQRGHGWSGHPADGDYSRESYITDILNLVRQELGGQPVVILGHSLGGVNAYQLAARYPEYVRAVIVEDIGAEIHADLSFAEKLPERSTTLQDLRDSLARLGLKAIDYFSESVFEDEKGWGFRTDLTGMRSSQENINGQWWEDWLSSTCPILLIHGKKSFVMNAEQAKLMQSRRPNTSLEIFENCGHGVHSDDPDGFYAVVKKFLDGLSESKIGNENVRGND
ncbi:alpha/beta hydrolase [Paenibacillus chitinolyticus]|uniref:Alpha/beta hydrolase n=1 Tax=Paenibacillus chitinolyticus TaxID=79263 RepID=A0A410WZP9_9BACL|nr:alpha/beta hydrolase [Paenibacillus chitinolyticus]MCY9590160.1 alpha/beta hydrolase [Paenibacillus chitinolyticus]MCY9596856.1 alpha/beta hydrolase [Paenibacillus chitinolyticus]QAV19830.1 alpha/beta hydrolase [Paenibacillus chitinolyticus]